MIDTDRHDEANTRLRRELVGYLETGLLLNDQTYTTQTGR